MTTDRESLTSSRRKRLGWDDVAVMREAGLDEIADIAERYLRPRTKREVVASAIAYVFAAFCMIVGTVVLLALVMAFWDWVL